MDDESRARMRQALTPEQRQQAIQNQIQLYVTSVNKKTEVLLAIASLAATLIVVATLNKELVPISILEAKVILTIFLLIIPPALYDFVTQMEGAAINAKKIIREYIPSENRDISEVSYSKQWEYMRSGWKEFFDVLRSKLAILTTYIITATIIFILLKVWQIL